MSNYLDNKELFMKPSVNQYGSHMVMSNVCKETKVKYLNVDTKFCDDLFLNDNNPANTITNNQANYNFTLPEKITDVKNIYVENVQFPSIQPYYNISEELGNNCFQYTISTTLENIDNLVPDEIKKLVKIPDGIYTIKSLIQEINTILQDNNYQIPFEVNDNGSTSTSRYNINLYFDIIENNCIYFYTDTEHSINITVDFAIDKNGNFDKYNFKSKLGWLLGFRKPKYIIYNTAIPFTYSYKTVLGTTNRTNYKNKMITYYNRYTTIDNTIQGLTDSNGNQYQAGSVRKSVTPVPGNGYYKEIIETIIFHDFPPSTIITTEEYETSLGNNLIQTTNSSRYNLPEFDLSPYKSQLMGESVIAFSENVPVFPLPTKYYYLVIDEFSTNFQNSFISTLPYSLINKYIICKININQSNLKSFANYELINSGNNIKINQGLTPGDAYYYPANTTNGYLTSSKRNYNGKTDIQKLNVKIIDENGNIVNLKGYDFSFCLKIEYE